MLAEVKRCARFNLDIDFQEVSVNTLCLYFLNCKSEILIGKRLFTKIKKSYNLMFFKDNSEVKQYGLL